MTVQQLSLAAWPWNQQNIGTDIKKIISLCIGKTRYSNLSGTKKTNSFNETEVSLELPFPQRYVEVTTQISNRLSVIEVVQNSRNCGGYVLGH